MLDKNMLWRHIGAMKLRQYLSEFGLTQEQFAEAVGISQSVVSRLVREESYASLEILLRIRDHTNGAVTPNDFLPPPPLARDSAAMAPAEQDAAE